MSKEININVENGVKELVIRQGQASPAPQPRKGINIIGTLGVVKEHLSKIALETVFESEPFGDSKLTYSHISVNREGGSIVLVEDAGMQDENTYTGRLTTDPRFEKFGINADKSYTTHELADFIRMNRSFFDTKDIAMKLESELRNFKAKVDKQIELSNNDRGDKRTLFAQTVDSNIPDSFSLNIPIFKGYPVQRVEVEVVVNSGDLSCKLISPNAADFIEETKDVLIDEELEEIMELHPALRVFEI